MPFNAVIAARTSERFSAVTPVTPNKLNLSIVISLRGSPPVASKNRSLTMFDKTTISRYSSTDVRDLRSMTSFNNAALSAVSIAVIPNP